MRGGKEGEEEVEQGSSWKRSERKTPWESVPP